jgi:hypothetical protein
MRWNPAGMRRVPINPPRGHDPEHHEIVGPVHTWGEIKPIRLVSPEEFARHAAQAPDLLGFPYFWDGGDKFWPNPSKGIVIVDVPGGKKGWRLAPDS